MCGIAGGIRHYISEEEKAQVRQRLLHRGPDDDGFWNEGPVWLLNTRLAIQDISNAGHQPMRTADGRYTLIFNGEIYNHLELRQKLTAYGAVFVSHCDTETLLLAFAQWGRDCLDLLEGDFAFAVYDAARQEVFIARDGMGVKPLYYYDDGEQFLFASELKALLGLHGLDYSLQPEAFADYLLYLYSPGAQTPFRNIKKLLPGHSVTITISQKTRAKPQPFFTIPLTGRNHHKRPNTSWTAQLDVTLSQTIARHLLSDAPIGFTLSGGLDSSLIAALARKARPHAAMNAFTINGAGQMKQEGFEDDLGYARIVAKQLDITLHEVDGQIDIAGELDAMIWSLDEPQADPAALHMAHIAQAARERGIKVLLSGTGADDIFSGYRRHQGISMWKLMPFVPGGAKTFFEKVTYLSGGNAWLRRAAKAAAGAGLSPKRAAITSHFWTTQKRIRMLLKGAVERGWPFQTFEDLLHEIPEEKDLLNIMLFWEMRTFLPHHNLAYMDKMGMAHSVEVRVPFVDNAVVALAAQIPPALKLRNGTTKAILRQMAKSYLPEAIIRRSKTGFGAPLRQWMRDDLSGFTKERLFDESFYRHGLFRREAVAQLITDNTRGRGDGAYTLFSLLCIESWLRQFAPTS